MALIGNMIAEASNGNPSVVNYAMFCSVFTMLSLIYLIPATIKEGLAFHPVIMIAVDVLNTIFTFCCAVALAAELGVHSCGRRVSTPARAIRDNAHHSEQDYIDNNGITDGTAPGNRSKRCHEAQASDAFLWFGFAAFAASSVLSGLSSRGGADLRGPGGIRRGGPSVSKV